MKLKRRFHLHLAITALLALTAVQTAIGQTLIGVDTNNQLVRFDAATPSIIDATIPITGLQSGETVLGIDVRPATGELYALGSTSRIYKVGYITGAATEVTSGPLTPALSGTEFGFDFNPQVDRIRIVSNTGQNLRVNPDTGALAGQDTNLAYALGDANEGATPNIVGAAYTQNVSNATTTTLYDIDSALDILTIQGGTVSPNTGQLFTVGALGLDVTDVLGFDIAPPAPETAYASVQLGAATSSTLITINLATGAATQVGTIGADTLVRGLTFAQDTDGDGVPDDADLCPATASNQPVDDTGCPVQTPSGIDYTGNVLQAIETCSPPTSSDPKCKIKVRYLAENIGNQNGTKTTINFYLSDDATFDSGDLLLRTLKVKLKAGKSVIKKFHKTTIEPTITGKFLIARIDPDSQIGELNETNNQDVEGPLPLP